MAQGDLAGALKSYEAKQAIIAELAKANPSNAEWQRGIAVSHGKVAWVLARQQQTTQALDSFQKARDIIKRLKEQSPDNATLPKDLAWYDAEIAKLKREHEAEPASDQPEQAAR